MNVWDLITSNFPLVATIVVFVAAMVLRERSRAWFEWANETLFMAFDNAEKRGILEGLPGVDKLEHYLNIWRQAYREQFGREPSENDMIYAVNKATELAKKEKTVREKVAGLANPKL